MVRVRVASPPPHGTVHGPQALHADTTQLIGHGKSLQSMVSSRAGQTAPPLAAGVTTVRVRRVYPLPQESEHGVQAPQVDTTQSTAHGLVLQPWDSTSGGQGTPPKLAWVMTVRVRVCWPPPQLRVQVDQVPQSDTTQSMAQGWSLHGRFSLKLVGHGAPPLAAAVVTVRMRV